MKLICWNHNQFNSLKKQSDLEIAFKKSLKNQVLIHQFISLQNSYLLQISSGQMLLKAI